MSNTEKKETINSIEVESFEISVVKDPKLKPFLNVFKLQGKNVAQTNLGELFGIIQVEDNGSNSEYIPNLITQVIKKEFFKNPKRGAEESFEHALHKANLALTDLAQHEIIEWMGGFNAVVGAIKDNRIFFVQVGKAKVFLLRNKDLLDITPNKTENSITHPVKTFSSLSSGEIKTDDKIMLALENALDFITFEELQRHCKTFNSDEFDNIFSSTLESDGENTGAIVINAKEKIRENKKKEVEKKPEKGEENYFGAASKKEEEENSKQKSKIEEPTKNKNISKEDNFNDTLVEKEEIENLIAHPHDESTKKNETGPEKKEINQEEDSNIPPFEKEPEIYLKEEDLPSSLEEDFKKKEEKLKNNHFEDFKEKFFTIVKKIKTFFVSYLKEIKFKQKVKNIKNKDLKSKFEKIKQYSLQKLNASKEIIIKNTKNIFYKKNNKENNSSSKEEANQKTSNKHNKIPLNSSLIKKSLFLFVENLSTALKKITVKFHQNKKPRGKGGGSKNFIKKYKNFSFDKIIPTFLKVKVIPRIKNRKKKVYFILLGLFLVTITILLLVNIYQIFFNSEQLKSPAEQKDSEQTIAEKRGEKVENLASIKNFNSAIEDLVKLNNNIFLLTKNQEIYSFNEQENSTKTVSLPPEMEKPRYLASMPSLQLLLIISENSVYSYSPVTGNLFKNNINLPEEFENNKGVGTYLTYLYLPEESTGQIYRYPRSRGGFDTPRKWFDNPINLKEVEDIAISDSIYLIHRDGKILKYFQGKKEFEISPENDFVPKKIEAKVDAESFFVLDIKNGEIIKFNIEGEVEKKFKDKRFQDATSFRVDFDRKKVYVLDKENNLLVFPF
ncbi:MAG: hypothetical protein R6V40_02955 [Candidatus Moraniibacteriota bacterium]